MPSLGGHKPTRKDWRRDGGWKNRRQRKGVRRRNVREETMEEGNSLGKWKLMVRGIEAPTEGGKEAGYVEGRLGGGQKGEKEKGQDKRRKARKEE